MAITPTTPSRIFLSPPHWEREEELSALAAIRATVLDPSPELVYRFEEAFCALVGSSHAVALSSGTAALHLALITAGVGEGDDVMVPTFTFCASVNPILYVGARPILLDVSADTWHLDLDLLESELQGRDRAGKLPKALVLVHLYGQAADADAARVVCDRYGVTLIEDAAEALGADCNGRQAGTIGASGIFSFNNNKIVSAGGGGMLITEDRHMADRARKLATQARESARHYQHEEVGYNYRLSQILSAVGAAQLEKVEQRVAARRNVFERYRTALSELDGVHLAPGSPVGRSTRWLSCLLVDDAAPFDIHDVLAGLDAENIEARPLWKPMHQQPAYENCEVIGGAVADDLFARGLSLPSGSNLGEADQQRVVDALVDVYRQASRGVLS